MDLKIRIKLYTKIYGKKLNQIFSFGHFDFPLRKMVAVTLSIAILLSGGTFGIRTYAYNSDSVTPKHFFYDLKRNIEVSKLESLESVEKRISLYLQFADRRFDEAGYILQGKQVSFNLIPQTYADETVDIPEDGTVEELLVESNNFQTLAIEELNSIHDIDKLEPIIKNMQKWQGKQNQRYESIQKYLENGNKKAIHEKISEAKKRNFEELGNIELDVEFAKEDNEKQINIETKPMWLERREGKHKRRQFPRHHMKKMRINAKMHHMKKLQEKGISTQELKQMREEVKKHIKNKDFEKANKIRKDFHNKWFTKEEQQEIKEKRMQKFNKRLKRFEKHLTDEQKKEIDQMIKKGDLHSTKKYLKNIRKEFMPKKRKREGRFPQED